MIWMAEERNAAAGNSTGSRLASPTCTKRTGCASSTALATATMMVRALRAPEIIDDDIQPVGKCGRKGLFKVLNALRVLGTKIEGNNNIGAERTQGFEFLRIAACDDHLSRSKLFRDLNGDEPCSAGCTVDENSLASLEAGALDQRGEAGHAGVRQGGSGYIVQVVGQDDDSARVDKGLLRHRSERSFGHGEVHSAAVGEGAHAVHAGNKGILVVCAIVRAGGSAFRHIGQSGCCDGDDFETTHALLDFGTRHSWVSYQGKLRWLLSQEFSSISSLGRPSVRRLSVYAKE